MAPHITEHTLTQLQLARKYLSEIALRLSHQALLLIGTPLVLELALMGVLTIQVKRLAQEYRNEVTARQPMMSVNDELRSILEGTAAFGVFQMTKDERYRSKYGTAMENLKRARRDLDLVKDPGPELQPFNVLIDQTLDTLDRVKGLLETGDKIDMLRSMLKLQHLLQKVEENGSRVIRAQIQEAKVHQQQVEHTTSQLELLVLLGAVLSCALAGGLGTYFTLSTTTRLGVLMQNTLALAAGAPLQKQLTGTDEIAKIDQTFHAMAEALADAQRKEEALTANAADIICSLDDQGRFSKVNQAVKSVLGYEPDDLLGRQIFSLMPETELDKARMAFANAVSATASTKVEMSVYRRDRTICDVLWSMQYSAPEQSLFCVLHDISERKQAERLKQEVLAMVSHDLRAPLTSLNVMFDLFEVGMLGQLNEKGEAKVHYARNVITRLMSLINDLLDMEKLESGVFELDYTTESAEVLAQRAVETLRDSADKKQLNVIIREPAQPLDLDCDSSRLVRVITNLLDNAIKFSPQGGQLIVQTQSVEGRARFSIQDQGKGVPPDKVHLIFERFKQSDSSGEIEKKGTGLGLAICKAIVEAHHGVIGVTSQPGQGSIFWFELPVHRLN